MALGNPAPFGLLCFGMTTLFLMYVEMEWVNSDFEIIIAGTAIALGGLGQIIVSIFELIKGSSFSFAVFGCYGAFWLGWAITYLATSYVAKSADFDEEDQYLYTGGKTAWLAQWGVLTLAFWVITTRKNIALICIFTLLTIAFWLLAAATHTGNRSVKLAGGWFGFFTAIGAFYTGVAELVNEEWGQHILPGLRPILTPQRTVITVESIRKLCLYDSRSNSLFLSFRGLQIKCLDHVQAIKEGVTQAIIESKSPDNKVHVVADYDGTFIGEDIRQEYWTMASELERQYYLSVTRFMVSSFGTPQSTSAAVATGNAAEVSGYLTPATQQKPAAPPVRTMSC